jgi:putative peptidoglycan lipid II flippase
VPQGFAAWLGGYARILQTPPARPVRLVACAAHRAGHGVVRGSAVWCQAIGAAAGQWHGLAVGQRPAFFAAFRLPNFFRRIFAEGAFNSAFVPIFIEKLQDKKTDADEKFFVRNIFSILFYALLFFTIIFQIFMPTFMKILFPGFFSDPEKSALLINLSRITIFYLIFISLVSLCSGILNSLNKFAVPASSPIILNATLIASVFVFGPIAPNYAYALSWGVFIAGILQFLWLFFFTIKAGFLVYPNFPTINSDIKKFFRKLVPGVIGANVMQINLLVDSIFANL